MPLRTQHLSVLVLLPLLAAADGLFAQQIAIQQPTIEAFSAGTTVSVPDRGRIQLGGVGRGASSRSVYGPLRTSSNFARSFSGGSISVGATIHDFDHLDRRTLAAAGRDATSNTRSERAYQMLHERSRREAAALTATAQTRLQTGTRMTVRASERRGSSPPSGSSARSTRRPALSN